MGVLCPQTGGGMGTFDSETTIKDIWLTGNRAKYSGGGINPIGSLPTFDLQGITFKDNFITLPDLRPSDIGGAAPACGSSCGAGHHGNCTHETADTHQCPSCVVGQCIACAVGKAHNTSGATTAEDCLACPNGYYTSNEGATVCEGPCPAGSYTTDDANDTDGVGVTSGGTHCVMCPPGRYNNESGQGSCAACELGSASGAGATTCTSCSPGTYADTKGAETCASCPDGTYTVTSGAVSCAACEAGTESATGAAACSACPRGKASEGGGAPCTSCAVGEYAPTDGLAACLSCEKPLTSAPGSANCTSCIATYFRSDRARGNCRVCPTGAVCSDPLNAEPGAELSTLEIEPGYFRFGTMSEKVYECPKAKAGATACAGGNGTGDQLCGDEYAEALCSRCAPEHYRDLVSGECASCHSDHRWITPTIFILVGIIMVAVAAAVAFYGPLRAYYLRREDRITRMRDQATMLFITGQIIVNLQSAHRYSDGGGFPEPYDSAVTAVEMIALDIFQLFRVDCVEGGASYERKLHVATLVPLGLSVFTIGVQRVVVAVYGGRVTRGTGTKGVLMLLFYLLPTTSAIILSAFQCSSFDDGTDEPFEVMTIDMAVDCSSPERQRILAFASVMVAVYPVGVPCGIGFMLWLRRGEIAARATRGGGTPLTTLSFLFRNYAPVFGWWMPVVDLVRRLCLSSALLLFRTRSTQMVMALVGAIAFTVSFREIKPYYDGSTDRLAYACMWLIVLCTTGLLLLDVREDPEWRNTIAISLFGGTVALVLFAVYLQWYGDNDGGASAAVAPVGAGAGAGQGVVGGNGGGAADSPAAGTSAGDGNGGAVVVSGGSGGSRGGGGGGDTDSRERKNVMSSFGVKKHKIAPKPAPLPALPTPVIEEGAASEPELESGADLSQPHGLFSNSPDTGASGLFANAPATVAAAATSGASLFSNAPVIDGGGGGGGGGGSSSRPFDSDQSGGMGSDVPYDEQEPSHPPAYYQKWYGDDAEAALASAGMARFKS